MSEKHLTELPWKTLAVKQGVKDLGLQKALSAYAKVDPDKDAAEALKVLEEVNGIVLKLKKIKPPLSEDVVDYLDEIIREVKKTTPVLEGRIKAGAQAAAAEKAKAASEEKAAAKAGSGEDEDDDAEVEEFKKDLKKQMVSALSKVKTLAPGDPAQEGEPKPQLKFMACVAGKNSSVIVARKVGSSTKKLLLEIAGIAGGGKFVSGECIFEKGAHTFVVDEAPPGLAKSLATALRNETELRYKVRARTADGLTELDSDTDIDEAEIPAAPSPNPAAAPSPNQDALRKFTDRLKELLPVIKANPQIKVATGTPGEMTLMVAASEAGGFAKQQNFAKANELLDQIERAAKERASAKSPAPEPGGAPQSQVKLSTYLNGRKNLRAARESAEKELKRLRDAILAKAAGEPFYKDVEARSETLFEYLAPINDSLVDKLDEAGRSTDPEEQAEKNRQVQQIIHQQLESLQNHRLASFVQANPFGQFAIRQPLETALSTLDQQLG